MEEQNQQSTPQSEKPKKKRTGNIWLLIALILVVVIVILYFIYIYPLTEKDEYYTIFDGAGTIETVSDGEDYTLERELGYRGVNWNAPIEIEMENLSVEKDIIKTDASLLNISIPISVSEWYFNENNLDEIVLDDFKLTSTYGEMVSYEFSGERGSMWFSSAAPSNYNLYGFGIKYSVSEKTLKEGLEDIVTISFTISGVENERILYIQPLD